jgi:hypothetical protein
MRTFLRILQRSFTSIPNKQCGHGNLGLGHIYRQDPVRPRGKPSVLTGSCLYMCPRPRFPRYAHTGQVFYITSTRGTPGSHRASPVRPYFRSGTNKGVRHSKECILQEPEKKQQLPTTRGEVKAAVLKGNDKCLENLLTKG